MNEESIRIVGILQTECKNAFTKVMSSLQAGMSESDIASTLRKYLENHGIKDYWYDIPLNVLIGVERFRLGTTTTDYAIKAPSPEVLLEKGDVVFVDLAPMDTSTGTWGDWASTCVFNSTNDESQEQLSFLAEMRALHRKGIAQITAQTSGAEVAQYFLDQFKQRGVTLLDVRNNVGHSIHCGPKNQAHRTWLDLNNFKPLGPGIYAVEPGGLRRDGSLVARFEECILIPPSGHATIIGSSQLAPLAF